MKKGFTLLELLVAITILIIGILGVSQMVAQGMRYNVQMRHLLIARQLAERQMENFEILRITDPLLVDPENGTVIDYDDPPPGDHNTTVTVDTLPFLVYWNVVADHRVLDVDARFRTVRLFVEWQTDRTRRISNDYIRWEER